MVFACVCLRMALTLSTLRTRAYSCVRARVAIIERSVGSVRDRRASPPKARSKPRGLFANARTSGRYCAARSLACSAQSLFYDGRSSRPAPRRSCTASRSGGIVPRLWEAGGPEDSPKMGLYRRPDCGLLEVKRTPQKPRRPDGLRPRLMPRVAPRLSKRCTKLRSLPIHSPVASAYFFQELNKSVLSSKALGSRLPAPSNHALSASSASRYSFVASLTAAGGSRPRHCQSRHPSIIQAIMPAHSARSFSPNVSSRSSGGMLAVNGRR